MTGKYEYPLTQGEPAAFEVSRKLMTYDAAHPDRMRSYGYERCEYDATGRPSVYRDHPCTWERGMLKTYSRNGIDTVYGYDAGGGRTSKTVTKQRDVVDGDGNTVKDEFGNAVTESFTVTTAYTYLGDKLIRQSDGADTLDFFYDDSGLRMINHNGTDYIVRKNIMGDVTHLYTTEGKMVGKYVYDAWGNPLRFCTSERVSQLNPILYRGYCYDPETRLYYLKTRYYDPEACRFISSDDENILLLTADHANGIMSYTYCANNPVIDTDSDGQMPNWLKWLLGGVFFIAAVALTVVTGGALAPVFGGMALSILGGGLAQGTINAINGGDFWQGFMDGAADGALWGGVFAFAGASINVVRFVQAKNITKLTAAMKNPMYALDTGVDCSEIAEDLMKVIGGKGKIINMTGTAGKWIKIAEQGGRTTEYVYHQVFKYAGRIFDPRYSLSPVLSRSYLNVIRNLNPLGIIIGII